MNTEINRDTASTTAIISETVRVWENTPHQAIIPCVDQNGSRFELVLEHSNKEAFDAINTDLERDENGTVDLVVSGSWNKRMWRKTKVPGGGWGHTWQLFVDTFSFVKNGETITLGQPLTEAA